MTDGENYRLDAVEVGLREVRGVVDRVEKWIIGGTDGKSGLLVRMSNLELHVCRLETAQEKTNRFLYGILAALVMAVVGFLWSILTHSIAIVGKIP